MENQKTDLKRCNKCGKDLPRTDEYFEPCKARTADGRRNSCRQCERERDAAYRRRKRAERAEQQAQAQSNG